MFGILFPFVRVWKTCGFYNNLIFPKLIPHETDHHEIKVKQ